jgi:hypothetical protein
MVRNEPKTFMSEFISKQKLSSKELLKLIKVDKGKCDDEAGVSS